MLQLDFYGLGLRFVLGEVHACDLTETLEILTGHPPNTQLSVGIIGRALCVYAVLRVGWVVGGECWWSKRTLGSKGYNR